jgi:formylglycine-generating enzyme required for sulfatase activity
MKRFIYTVSIILTIIILSLGAEETKNVPESGKHFGQIESIYCNATVAPEGQATIPVQFQAMASKGHRAGDLVAVDNIAGIMRFVPATGPEGFLQGSPASEPGRGDNETQFTHILTRNIAVMETEVTIAMWNALKSVQPGIGSNPTNNNFTYYKQGNGRNPVQNVAWGRAVIFANLLSIQNGLVPCYYVSSAKNLIIGKGVSSVTPIYCDFSANGYRLPTEGEWEYFTRAGTTTPFSIDEPNYNTNYTTCGVHPQLKRVAIYCLSYTYYVGTKLPNPWNLKDVHGNVSEWCWDIYGEYPTETVTDYQGGDTGNNHVYRGGWFEGKPVYCRSAQRLAHTAVHYSFGFRLVRTL